ncbi:DUF1667 domain-containing protein [Fusobacterium perfoetens]|uniref:DUF1667 domain-containing protein n=1 Tax=Fusobacterium perfoetens TaxID=852 RepID=UPI0004833D38|nr:DUF1667 domain-containing protein [Fusobacterium perfoetens]MCI6152698.1 DUF1667 domain-containing protein [Fusobacterium perfoetens]MDY3236592.1 DUF1667 domain-containing protein [Fusobacterium perfoetens]
MKKEMICIVCPMGCHLTIDTDTLDVTGNTCPRGAEYAKEELVAPKRVITSTVRITGGLHHRLPVKTNGAIPKDLNFKCMEELAKVELKSPVKVGDVVIKNVLNTGVDVVACRDM